MTIKVKYTAEIKRPIEQVFAAAIDIAGLPRWSNVRAVRRLSSAPVKLGSTFQLVSHLGGEDRVVDGKVTVCDAPQKFVYVSTGVGKSEIGFELQSADDHTKVVYSVAVTVNALIEPLIKGELEKQAKLDLTRFVKLLEASK
jgi:uncharacterized protein YndB with AHSA1/START domain